MRLPPPFVQAWWILGYEPAIFHFDAAIPRDVGIVFSFAPYGRFAPICRQLQEIDARQRPFLIDQH